MSPDASGRLPQASADAEIAGDTVEAEEFAAAELLEDAAGLPPP
jgi:hypothetical protein